MRIHWHRRDLRLADNIALNGEDPVVGLFVLDPDILAHAGPPRVAFLLDALEALRTAYQQVGGTLLLAHGQARDVVPALASSHAVESVSWGRDYSGLAQERDQLVRERLQAERVDSLAADDAVLHAPGSITTNEDSTYQVFTYFSRKWHDRAKPAPADTPDTVSFVSADRVSSEVATIDTVTLLEEVPTCAELDVDEPMATVPTGTPDIARDHLDSFCEDDIYQYEDERDYPARAVTSCLSPHLAMGTIGIRTVYEATEQAYTQATDDPGRTSVREFQDQLAWREFYTHVLADRPEVVTQNFKTYENPIEWQTDPAGVAAWKAGETGFPIVDAGMRQLREEAFMHNRVRMIVASFLTKDLMVDWRVGYQWFRQKLVDHDTANDSGGWQWAASTGTDAQPYFRVFNPMTQGERYDPDAAYIKRYIPSLTDVPVEDIHSWDDLDDDHRVERAPGYPAPIVDHAKRREAAIEMFERARGDT